MVLFIKKICLRKKIKPKLSINYQWVFNKRKWNNTEWLLDLKIIIIVKCLIIINSPFSSIKYVLKLGTIKRAITVIKHESYKLISFNSTIKGERKCYRAIKTIARRNNITWVIIINE